MFVCLRCTQYLWLFFFLFSAARVCDSIGFYCKNGSYSSYMWCTWTNKMISYWVRTNLFYYYRSCCAGFVSTILTWFADVDVVFSTVVIYFCYQCYLILAEQCAVQQIISTSSSTMFALRSMVSRIMSVWKHQTFTLYHSLSLALLPPHSIGQKFFIERNSQNWFIAIVRGDWFVAALVVPLTTKRERESKITRDYSYWPAKLVCNSQWRTKSINLVRTLAIRRVRVLFFPCLFITNFEPKLFICRIKTTNSQKTKALNACLLPVTDSIRYRWRVGSMAWTPQRTNHSSNKIKLIHSLIDLITNLANWFFFSQWISIFSLIWSNSPNNFATFKKKTNRITLCNGPCAWWRNGLVSYASFADYGKLCVKKR